MAGGLWSRLKVWGLTEIIQNSDLNKEFDNIKNNFTPQQMASYSASITQANKQTAPGATGAEVLPTALSGDVENLRYQVAQIIGDPSGLWRATPAQSLSSLNTLAVPGGIPQNRIVSGRQAASSLQPMHLVPAGNAATATIKGASTNLVTVINNSQYTLMSDLVTSTLSLAPSSNNTCLLNDDNTTTIAAYATKSFGDWRADFETPNPSSGALSDYDLIVTSMGSNISALIGTYAAFMYQHAAGTKEYFLGYVQSSTIIRKCFRGWFFDSSDNPIVAQALSTPDAITLMKLAWIYLVNNATTLVSYTNPRYSAEAPLTPAPAAGDFWYDTLNQQWKQYNGGVWTAQNCHLVGITVQDGINCVAARSFDAYRSYGEQGNVVINQYSNTEIRGKFLGSKINVYGQVVPFERDFVRWVTPGHLDSGVTISTNTTYFLYITEQGKSRISDKAPQRRVDLFGYYHPTNPWRCFGLIYSDGSSNFDQYRIAALPQLSGEFVSDKTLSVSKRKFMPQGSSVGLDGVAGSGIASFSTSSNSFVNVTDSVSPITCTLQTSGRPIFIGILPTSILNKMSIGAAAAVQFQILVDGATSNVNWGWNPGASLSLPWNFWGIIQGVTIGPGSHVFTLQVKTSADTIVLAGGALLAFEL